MTPPPTGQTQTQGWEFGIRRTLPLPADLAWDLLLTAVGLDPTAPYEKGHTTTTADGTRLDIRSHEPGRLLRTKWQPPGWQNNSTLQLRITPAKTGVTLSIHHEWLADADQREAMRQRWSAALDSIQPPTQTSPTQPQSHPPP